MIPIGPRVPVLVALLLAAGAGFAIAPIAAQEGAAGTLNCTTPTTGIEVIVCSSPELSVLDGKLAEAYRAVEGKSTGAADGLAESQAAWIKTRNACWKDPDRMTCTADAYKTRTALLQARYALIPALSTVVFDCNEGEAGRIEARFFETDPATVVLRRGDETIVAPIAPSGSGARYLAENGVSFWNKGNEATVEWPAGSTHACHAS